MDFITNNLALVLGAAIVVIGLFVFGIRDLARFSLVRTWAISGVCFDESIRRRVLWITPLAILGVIIVSQLTRPFDEQDVIRQTAKFSLFATGMVVAVVIIILAATNLPREIENRVIYTIVTKPTTRLEIIVGKVLGFARVSAAILLIMGLFTWGYLGVRAMTLQRQIRADLESGTLTAAHEATLRHYAEYGLLTAKNYAWPDQLQVYARAPEGDTYWFRGDSEGSIAIPFEYSAEDFIAPGQRSLEDGSIVVLIANLVYDQEDEVYEPDLLTELGVPTTQSSAGVGLPAPMLKPVPRIIVEVLDQMGQTVIAPQQIEGVQRGVALPRGGGEVRVVFSPQQAVQLASLGRFFIQITGITPGTTYGVRMPKAPEESPVFLWLTGVQSGQGRAMHPTQLPDERPLILFHGRRGSYGQQLPGAADSRTVAIYRFRDAHPKLINDGKVPFEMRIGIERSGAEADDPEFTRFEMVVVNRATGQASEPTIVRADSNRNTYFELPAAMMEGGDFDLVIRNTTRGHWAGLREQSVQMVVGNDLFGWNLFKSLLILWLMSVLVVIVAIFCSTWLSWPIAVILSVVILLGHWGVQQIGDVGNELGRQVAQEMFPTGAPQARVISTSVNAMTEAVRVVGSFLPDISRFSATDDLVNGVSIPALRVGDAARVAFGFGLPLMVLAYVILRNKEVAP